MSDESQIDQVMRRLRTGDQQAATDVFHRFVNRLMGLVRKRLDPNLQRKVAPDDIVQSAFRSFFGRQQRGEFEIHSWKELWSLLVVITIHKCGHQIRYYKADRRDAGLEQSAIRFSEDSVAGWEAVAQDPTPSQAAALAETVENLMRSLLPRERQILELSLQGASIDEIRNEAQCSERTVRRVMEHVRLRLENDCTFKP
jgi:DNA-directed RNA polymerase specialized sigma24 family protein